MTWGRCEAHDFRKHLFSSGEVKSLSHAPRVVVGPARLAVGEGPQRVSWCYLGGCKVVPRPAVRVRGCQPRTSGTDLVDRGPRLRHLRVGAVPLYVVLLALCVFVVDRQRETSTIKSEVLHRDIPDCVVVTT